MFTQPIRYRDFLKYGSTIRSSDDLSAVLKDYTYQLVEPSHFTHNTVYTYEQPVYIEPAAGTGILLVFRPGKDGAPDCEQFLFSRPVRINAGIPFCLYPYESDFSFHLFSTGSKVTQDMDIQPFLQRNFIKFNINRIYSFLYREEPRGLIFKGEKHNFWELLYVDKGVVTSLVEGEKYCLRPGDVIFCHPNEYHALTAENQSAYLNITFNMETYSNPLLEKRVYSTDMLSAGLFQSIIQEQKNPDAYSVDAVASYIKLIILRLEKQNFPLENTLINSSHTAKRKSMIIKKAVRIIDDSLYSPSLSVEYLADKLHISSSHLFRIFKEKIGQNIQDYISDRKLEQACSLIAAGSMPLAQIAETLNFCSPSYFSTKFRKKYGLSPRDYSKSVNAGRKVSLTR